MEVLLYDNERLRRKSLPFDFNQEDIKALDIAQALYVEVEIRGAMGLSAPQIGIPYRIFVFSHEGMLKTAVNPKILEQSVETELAKEGCLSYPGLFIAKRRPKTIKVSYYTCDYLPITLELEGYEARCFLHEYEHLEGILLLDNISALKRKMALKKWKR